MTEEQRIRLSEHYESMAERALNFYFYARWISSGEVASPRLQESLGKLLLRAQELNEKSLALRGETWQTNVERRAPPPPHPSGGRAPAPTEADACAGGRVLRKPAWLIPATLALALALQGCAEEGSAPTPRPVRTVTVDTGESLDWHSFPGVTAAVDQPTISFRVSGLVVAVEADIGDDVQVGQVLARLDPRDFELAVENVRGELESARATLQAMEAGERTEIREQRRAGVESARAHLDRVESDHRRYQELLRDQVISQAEFDGVEAEYRTAQADLRAVQQRLIEAESGARPEDIEAQRSRIESLEAQLETAQNNLEYTVLRATFPGRIATREIEPSQNVQAHQTAFTVSNLSLLKMTVGIPEEMYRYRDRIERVEVRLNQLPGHAFEVIERRISPDIDPQSQTYPAEARFDNSEELALPGMSGEVRVAVRDGQVAGDGVAMIPLTSIFTSGDGQKAVWLLEDGRVHAHPIETGPLGQDLVPVVSGLQDGDVVVTAGVHQLVEGMAVRVAESGGGNAP